MKTIRFEFSKEDIERFWSKVDKTGLCWAWNPGKDQDGYGQFWIDNIKRSLRAHRVSYFLHTESYAPDFVLHKCDNTSCVNPDHLQNQKDIAKIFGVTQTNIHSIKEKNTWKHVL